MSQQHPQPLENSDSYGVADQTCPPLSPGKIAALTPMQRDLYLDYLVNRDEIAFSIGLWIHLGAVLDIEIWRKAIALAVERDDIPRTVFLKQGEEVLQTAKDCPPHFEFVDLRGASTGEQRLEEIVLSKIRVRYDLFSSQPQWRNYVLLDRDGEYTVLVTTHHIISDGPGLVIYLNRVCAIYSALLEQRPVEATFPSFYTCIETLGTPFDTAETREYWRAQLEDVVPLQVWSKNGGVQQRQLRTLIDGHKLQHIRNFCSLHKCSLPTYFRFLYCALLSRYYDAVDDFVFYNLLNGRSAESAEAVGCFYHILPTVITRALLSKQANLTSLLLHIHNYRKTPGARQYISMLLQKQLLRYEPVRFYYNFYNFGYIHFLGKELDFIGYDYYGANEVHLVVDEKHDKVELFLYYDRNVFSDEHFLDRLLVISEQILAGAEHLSSLSILLPQERAHILNMSSSVAVEHRYDPCFSRSFAAQVVRTPDAIAVAYEEEQLSYDTLYQRSLSLAAVLKKQGVGEESLVALLAERGTTFLLAILAIFQAGGAYLPLNPSHPAKQLSLVLSQCQASLVLTSSNLQTLLTQAFSDVSAALPPVLSLSDLLMVSEEGRDSVVPFPASTPANLAYVIYTSGSTGVPKGAMIEQGGMLNHLQAKIADLHLSASDTLAQNASQSFDISVWQMLAPLLVGARTQIISESLSHDPLALFTHCQQQYVSVLEIVPSLLDALFALAPLHQQPLPALSELRWLISTGEALSPSLAHHWLHCYPHVALLNGYGPTECSDDVSHALLSGSHERPLASVPIGRALPNLSLYVLDISLSPVPLGQPGELFVGGIGVGRGYLHDPALTALSFLPDPLNRVPGARLYRTGDRGRQREDGLLEFLGRADTQVKVSGYRVELSEIEAALTSQPGVSQGVVLLRQREGRAAQLIAYVVGQPGHTLSRERLMQALRQRLPEYMLPSGLAVLDALPLTAHGKINRQALSVPALQDMHGKAHLIDTLPTTAMRLADIWSQELGLEQVSMHDDFFSLGGNSLSAIHILARIQQLYQVEFSLRDLFLLSTLAGIAGYIDACLSRKATQS